MKVNELFESLCESDKQRVVEYMNKLTEDVIQYDIPEWVPHLIFDKYEYSDQDELNDDIQDYLRSHDVRDFFEEDEFQDDILITVMNKIWNDNWDCDRENLYLQGGMNPFDYELRIPYTDEFLDGIYTVLSSTTSKEDCIDKVTQYYDSYIKKIVKRITDDLD